MSLQIDDIHYNINLILSDFILVEPRTSSDKSAVITLVSGYLGNIVICIGDSGEPRV